MLLKGGKYYVTYREGVMGNYEQPHGRDENQPDSEAIGFDRRNWMKGEIHLCREVL